MGAAQQHLAEHKKYTNGGRHVIFQSKSYCGGRYILDLLEHTGRENEWIATVGVPVSKTPFKDAEDYIDRLNYYWIDSKPEGWELPFDKSDKPSRTQKEALRQLHNMSERTETIYGTGEKIPLIIRIEQNTKNTMTISKYAAMAAKHSNISLVQPEY